MSNKRYFITLLTVYLLLLNCYTPAYAEVSHGGQDKTLIDSLNQAYAEAKHDTEKINCLFALGDALIGSNQDTVLIIERSIQKLAETNLAEGAKTPGGLSNKLNKKYLWSVAEALNNIGFIYTNQGNNQQGFKFFRKSLKIKEEIGDKEGVALAMHNLGYMYEIQGENVEAMEYYLKSLKIRREIGDKRGIAMTLNNIGLNYKNQGDIAKGLEYYLMSLKIQKEIGNKMGMASCLNNIGFIYSDQGDIPKALEYYHKSLKIKEEEGNKRGIALSLNNLGYIYDNQGDLVKGLEYYFKSLKIREEIGDKKGMAVCYNNIGTIYHVNGDITKALEFFHKSLSFKEEIRDKKGVGATLNNIGLLYQTEGDPSCKLTNEACRKAGFLKSFEYYFRSLKIRQDIGDKKGISSSLNHIGQLYLDIGDIKKAKEYASECLKLANELGFPDNVKRAAQLSFNLYKTEGNYELALEMYELFIEMRDSIKNEGTLKATIRQQTKYEFEKAQIIKEQEEKERRAALAETQRRRDNLQYSIVLICLLVIGVVVAMLGSLSLPVRIAEGIIFFSFLILFEFLLVLADPYIDAWSGGAPGIKLLFNAAIAALIFPVHAFFESRLKGRLVKAK